MELEEMDNEQLARAAGEALQAIAKRGRRARLELFQMIDSLEEKDEIENFLREYVEGEEANDLINQSDADDVSEG